MLNFSLVLATSEKYPFVFLKYIYYLIFFILQGFKNINKERFGFFSEFKINSNRQQILRQKKLRSSCFSSVSDDYSFPSIELRDGRKIPGIEAENKKNAELNTSLLANVLNDFKISGDITNVRQGPIVTLFELTPAPGTLSSSVIRLSDDIARSMSAKSTRISTIPGKDAIGIEIPNKQEDIRFFLRELIDDEAFKKNSLNCLLLLERTIFGSPVIVDLAKMPHLLVQVLQDQENLLALMPCFLSLYCLLLKNAG